MHYYVLDLPSKDVRGLFNGSGAVTHRYQYSPFGEQQAASEGTHNPLRFAARELDAQTGLYYVRARWYDPYLGRFLSEDPIGLAGGMNEYAYAANDPVNLGDPSGLRHDGGTYCTSYGYTQSPWQIGSRFWEFEHEGQGWHAHESNGWIALCPNYTGRRHDDGTGPSMRGHRPIDWGPILDPVHADIAAAEEKDRRCIDARNVTVASFMVDGVTVSGLTGSFGAKSVRPTTIRELLRRDALTTTSDAAAQVAAAQQRRSSAQALMAGTAASTALTVAEKSPWYRSFPIIGSMDRLMDEIITCLF